MDKRIILAVAGSGKTSFIVKNLSLEKRALIITYTNANIKNIERKIVKQFGYIPKNITILTYFSFLYSFCFKPLLAFKFDPEGVNFKPNLNRFAKMQDSSYFLDTHNRLYSNRIAKLIIKENIESQVIARIERYFDELYIDEIQDFGGNDFNLLSILTQTNLKILFVGDFYQYTYDTSRDGKINSTLHDDYEAYKRKFEDMGLIIDTDTLIKSWRCSSDVCKFVRDKLGINIYPKIEISTDLIEISNQDDADEIFNDNSIVKLFLQEHYKYKTFSNNWALSKGEDHYNDVCVILNDKTYKHYINNTLKELPPMTKNKLYVACTRARGRLFFVPIHFSKTIKVNNTYLL
jgi:DNA helicase-2/ATP-dependent DNA helicase PcrA